MADAFNTLITTAGLLGPTDMGHDIFPDFPSLSPCRYSTRGLNDVRIHRKVYEQLTKHFTTHGFPQPLPGRGVGTIRDWRFLSSDSNTRFYEVQKADKHIGENFGKVIYWLVCGGAQNLKASSGVAIIAYIDQHCQIIEWLKERFGYRVLRANADLNMAGVHQTIDKRAVAYFNTWLIIVPALEPQQPPISPEWRTMVESQRMMQAQQAAAQAKAQAEAQAKAQAEAQAKAQAEAQAKAQAEAQAKAAAMAVRELNMPGQPLPSPPALRSRHSIASSASSGSGILGGDPKVDPILQAYATAMGNQNYAGIPASEMPWVADAVGLHQNTSPADRRQSLPFSNAGSSIVSPLSGGSGPSNPTSPSSATTTNSFPFPRAGSIVRKKAPKRVVKVYPLAKALEDWDPEEDDEDYLPFKEGDILEVLDKSAELEADDWWRARIKGTTKSGLVPLDFLKLLPTESTPSKNSALQSVPESSSNTFATTSAAQLDPPLMVTTQPLPTQNQLTQQVGNLTLNTAAAASGLPNVSPAVHQPFADLAGDANASQSLLSTQTSKIDAPTPNDATLSHELATSTSPVNSNVQAFNVQLPPNNFSELADNTQISPVERPSVAGKMDGVIDHHSGPLDGYQPVKFDGVTNVESGVQAEAINSVDNPASGSAAPSSLNINESLSNETTSVNEEANKPTTLLTYQAGSMTNGNTNQGQSLNNIVSSTTNNVTNSTATTNAITENITISPPSVSPPAVNPSSPTMSPPMTGPLPTGPPFGVPMTTASPPTANNTSINLTQAGNSSGQGINGKPNASISVPLSFSYHAAGSGGGSSTQGHSGYGPSTGNAATAMESSATYVQVNNPPPPSSAPLSSAINSTQPVDMSTPLNAAYQPSNIYPQSASVYPSDRPQPTGEGSSYYNDPTLPPSSAQVNATAAPTVAPVTVSATVNAPAPALAPGSANGNTVASSQPASAPQQNAKPPAAQNENAAGAQTLASNTGNPPKVNGPQQGGNQPQTSIIQNFSVGGGPSQAGDGAGDEDFQGSGSGAGGGRMRPNGRQPTNQFAFRPQNTFNLQFGGGGGGGFGGRHHNNENYNNESSGGNPNAYSNAAAYQPAYGPTYVPYTLNDQNDTLSQLAAMSQIASAYPPLPGVGGFPTSLSPGQPTTVIENNNTNVTNNEYDTSNITNNTNIDDSTTTTVFDDSTTTLDYTSAFGSSPLAGLAAPAPMPDLSFSDPSLSTDYSSFMSPLAGLAPTTTSPPLFDYSDSTSPLAGLVPPPPLAADTTITESDTLVASDANGTLVASDDQVTTIDGDTGYTTTVDSTSMDYVDNATGDVDSWDAVGISSGGDGGGGMWASVDDCGDDEYDF
jgi:hypothetical protein